MICLGGYSRDIHLFDGSTQLGVIAIRNGRVDRCFGFGTRGEAAFYKLVHLRRGSYKVNEAQDMSASDAALTAYSWQELLMEAARRQDEAEYIAQSAAATGRVIAFPTPASHAAAHPSAFDLPTVQVASVALPASAAVAAPGPPARPTSFPALLDPIPAPPIPAPPSTGTPTPSTAMTAVPSSGPITISTGVVTEPDNERASAGLSAPHPDIAALLAEATTHYLRRDLARAEEILQQCLALRPGDRRVLQNLERIRRKKSQ